MTMTPLDEAQSVATSLNDASEVVHQRSRLAILAVLYEVKDTDFVELRRVTKLKDGNLSRHLQVLEEAKLVSLRKGFVGRRTRTGVVLTAKGRRAFEHEVQILRRVVSSAEGVRHRLDRPGASGRAVAGAESP